MDPNLPYATHVAVLGDRILAVGLASEMNPQDLDEWWAKAKEKALTPYSML